MKPTWCTSLLLLLTHVLTGQAPSFTASCEQANRLIEQGMEQTKTPKKIELMLQATALCPEADGPHFYHGLALEEREDKKTSGKNYGVAKQAYEKALTINPGHHPALYKLAGIEYVTGQFDSAAVHYDRYLSLDAPNKQNAATRQAAISLSVKCKWLALLPKGSVKSAALTRDPDRFAGVPQLLGDIALELGKSADQVTGKFGYGLAGAGVKLGIAVIEKINYSSYNSRS